MNSGAYQAISGGKKMRMKPKSMAGKRAKMSKVMDEFKMGKLRSGGSGKKVKSPKQAIAIGLSESGQSKRDKGMLKRKKMY